MDRSIFILETWGDMVMASGANAAFMKAGRNFLKNNIIEVDVATNLLISVAGSHIDPLKAVLAARGRVANRGADAAVNPTKQAGVYDFDLIKSARKAERSNRTLGISHMTSVPVYFLRPWGTKLRDFTTASNGTITYKTPNSAHPIRAYWVPWSTGTCWSVQLGNDADYFFTPTMDGCSLSISSGASPLVTHGNYRDPFNNAVTDQATTLAEINQQHAAHGTDVNRSLARNAYVASAAQKTAGFNNMVTVVGFRDPTTSTWSFYYQKRVVNANDANSKYLLEDRMVVI